MCFWPRRRDLNKTHMSATTSITLSRFKLFVRFSKELWFFSYSLHNRYIEFIWWFNQNAYRHLSLVFVFSCPFYAFRHFSFFVFLKGIENKNPKLHNLLILRQNTVTNQTFSIHVRYEQFLFRFKRFRLTEGNNFVSKNKKKPISVIFSPLIDIVNNRNVLNIFVFSNHFHSFRLNVNCCHSKWNPIASRECPFELLKASLLCAMC